MIGISFIGFEEALEKSLALALKNRASDKCYIATEDASVVLVDTDNISDESIWGKLVNRDGTTLVSVSNSQPESGKYKVNFPLHLQKPLRFSAMLNTIQQAYVYDPLSKPLSDPLVANAYKGIEASAIRATQEQADPESYLLGRLMALSHKVGEPYYKFEWADGKYFVFDKPAGMVFSTINKDVFEHVSKTYLSHSGVKGEVLSQSQSAAHRSDSTWEQDAETFLWALARHMGTDWKRQAVDFNAVYRLVRWPDLTRYSNKDVDITLSSFWVQNACTPAELEGKLNIPRGAILDFAASSLACGFLEKSDAQDRTREKPKKYAMKKTFKMIFDKLKRK